MSFSAWLLPCFFEGGGTSKNANADEEDEGAEKTTCRKERKNVLCLRFQRVAPFPLPSGARKEASGTASLFFFLWFFQIL